MRWRVILYYILWYLSIPYNKILCRFFKIGTIYSILFNFLVTFTNRSVNSADFDELNGIFYDVLETFNFMPIESMKPSVHHRARIDEILEVISLRATDEIGNAAH